MKTSHLYRLLPALLLLLAAGCATTPPPVAKAPEPNVPELAREPVAIAVFKQKRELAVVRNGFIEKAYPVRLGQQPQGTKQRQGDYRTPEGRYTICTIKPSRFQQFLWISYPNQQDAREALKRARLPQQQYDRILAAIDSGQCPPFDTPLGGAVGIHGDYRNPPRQNDWTEGCIAMTDNRNLMELIQKVKPGTPVVIYP